MIELSKTIGRLTVHLTACPMGNDWNIVLCGGDRPHIGAVALAVISCAENREACSLISLPNHREGEIAKRLATTIASRANATVCVSVGIHLENISGDEIISVNAIVESLTLELISLVRQR